jgi:hypothetical protein
LNKCLDTGILYLNWSTPKEEVLQGPLPGGSYAPLPIFLFIIRYNNRKSQIFSPTMSLGELQTLTKKKRDNFDIIRIHPSAAKVTAEWSTPKEEVLQGPLPGGSDPFIGENGKWKMENGKWKMENGKWKMENGKFITHHHLGLPKVKFKRNHSA